MPDRLDDLIAAAIANPGRSSWAALTERARMKPGEVVLINGATGTPGRLAIQVARLLGAGRIVATGRNAGALEEVRALGADVTIQLGEDMDDLEHRFMEAFAEGIDIVLEYLWGPRAENLLLSAARAGRDGAPMRFVQIGSISAEDITLPGGALRAKAVELMGSGGGSVALPKADCSHCGVAARNRVRRAADRLQAVVVLHFRRDMAAGRQRLPHCLHHEHARDLT